MADKVVFSDEQLDYMNEVLSIGEAHAVTALTQLLGCQMELTATKMELYSPSEVSSIVREHLNKGTIVRMDIVGEVIGQMLFMVPGKYKTKMIDLISRISPEHMKIDPEMKDSIVPEVGNILAGVYLTAIHDFTKLSIYHSMPTLVSGTVESILTETLRGIGLEFEQVFMTQNELVAQEYRMRCFLVMVLSPDEAQKLADSMEQVTLSYGFKHD